MKKQNVFYGILLMFSILFFGCSNLSGKTEESESQGVKFQIDIGMERTVVPSGFLNAKYTLTGNYGGESKTLAENKSISELQTQVFWLEKGTWSFTLDAYVDSAKKGTATISNQNISSSSATLTFTFTGINFDYANGTGGTAVTLTFPKTAKVAAVTAQLYNADGSENTNFTQNSLIPTDKNENLKQVTFTNSNVNAGSYLLVFNLYQDIDLTSKIGQWREIVNVANGCESASVINITNLNTLYSITYELNGLEWAEGFTAPSSYNACQGVVLPIAENFTNETEFGGWYTTEDFSGTAVKNWNAGDYSKDLKFYAKIKKNAADVDWSYPTSTPTLTWSGEGTVNNPYIITTSQQLADFSYMVNNGTSYSGQYIELGADIDLNYRYTVSGPEAVYAQWKPIGYSSYFNFRGSFEGNYHTVKGIYINSTCDYAGFFGYVSDAKIKNITVQGYFNSSFGYVGGIVACAKGSVSISSCLNEIILVVKNASNVGGIAGYLSSNGVISNCANKKEIICMNCSNSGGIVGYNDGTIKFSVNYNNISATISNTSDLNVGGIAGYNSNDIHNSENYGDITGESAGEVCVGGIIGKSNYKTDNKMNNNISCGAIKGKAGTYSYIGGIIGYAGSGYIKNNAFYGTVDGSGTSIYLCGIGYTSSASSTSCNYYLSGCGTTTAGVGGSKGTFTTYSDQITASSSIALTYTGTLLEVLNGWANDNSYGTWIAGSDGWPIHKGIKWKK